jgi:ferredoxin
MDSNRYRGNAAAHKSERDSYSNAKLSRRCVIFLRQPDAQGSVYGLNHGQSWIYFLGQKVRMNKEHLLERVSDFHVPTFFLCGPGPFMQVVSELLKEQGVSADRIKQESFGGKPSLAVPDPSAGTSVPFVEFLRSGFQFELIPDMSLLEFAETVGVSIPYGCRQGQCGTCATRLLQGSVTMETDDGLSAEQKQAGFILPCVSRLQGSISIDA